MVLNKTYTDYFCNNSPTGETVTFVYI